MDDEKKRNIFLLIILIVVISLGIILKININSNNDNKSNNKNISIDDGTNDITNLNVRGVVIKVDKDNLLVMDTSDTNVIIIVKYIDNDKIKYKQGQEILIYCNDMSTIVNDLKQIDEAEKIEIVKEKSDIEIPEIILKICYRSCDNVKVSIMYLTKTDVALKIKDTNEVQYVFYDKYIINKKNYENGLLEEAPKISSEEIKNAFVFGLDSEGNIDETVYMWENTYGELGERRIRIYYI